MALTIHQLALRLAKYLGVTTFDPGVRSNTDPLLQAALRPGDMADVVAAINGALQEFWELAPAGVRELFPERPSVTAQDVCAASDPQARPLLPPGWEESVLLPLALRRLSAHTDFQATADARAEIERQAVWAVRAILGMESDERPEAVTMETRFR